MKVTLAEEGKTELKRETDRDRNGEGGKGGGTEKGGGLGGGGGGQREREKGAGAETEALEREAYTWIYMTALVNMLLAVQAILVSLVCYSLSCECDLSGLL